MYTQLQLMRILNKAEQEHRQIIRQMEQTQPLLPEGYLAKCNNNYYRMIKHGSKKDQLIIPAGFAGRNQLINELQEKRFIAKGLPTLRNNLKYISKLKTHYKLYSPDDICLQLPEVYQDFDYSHLQLYSDRFPRDWSEDPSSQNPIFTTSLRHYSEGGLVTRSKAEAMISTKLEQRNIKFKYEPSLWLGSHHFYPDFAAEHIYEKRILYWEHLGMMDDPSYAAQAMEKLRIYSEHGICLGDTLIITWETSDSPLTFQHINDRIDRFLCSKK